MKAVPQRIIDRTKNCPYDFVTGHEQCKKSFEDTLSVTGIIPKANAVTKVTKAEVTPENNPYLIQIPISNKCYCTCPVYSHLYDTALLEDNLISITPKELYNL